MSEGRFTRNSDFSIGNVSGRGERARSSVWLEHRPFKPRVAGSNPVGPVNPRCIKADSGIDRREIPQYVDATGCGCVANLVGPVNITSAVMLWMMDGVEGYC